jgi:hypothetical protein
MKKKFLIVLFSIIVLSHFRDRSFRSKGDFSYKEILKTIG